jgi:hypothetical protein
MKEEFIPRISSRLQKKFDEIRELYTGWYGESKKLILEAYDIATNEDKYTPREAFKLLKKELSDICSPRLMSEYMPNDAKELKFDSSSSRKGSVTKTEDEDLHAIVSEQSSIMPEVAHELEALREGFRISQKQNEELRQQIKSTVSINLEDEDIAILITLLQVAIDESKYRHLQPRMGKLLEQFQAYLQPVYAQEDLNLK